ncbi:MAG: cell division protein ZapA [Bacteroidales bacterium]|jgi:cell division protein ZapA|nr:cell division protein ZapA [Bacteroidales bacterium]
MDKLSVTVCILDRKYKLTIDRKDEASLRKAAELIDSQAKEYAKVYGHQDNQDLLSMVALSQITQLVKLHEDARYKDKELIQKLSEIDGILSEELNKTVKECC